jgi:hypothetical protein
MAPSEGGRKKKRCGGWRRIDASHRSQFPFLSYFLSPLGTHKFGTEIDQLLVINFKHNGPSVELGLENLDFNQRT